MFELPKSTYYNLENNLWTRNHIKKIAVDQVWQEILETWRVFPKIGHKHLSAHIGIGRNKCLKVLQIKRGKKTKGEKRKSTKVYPNIPKALVKELDGLIKSCDFKYSNLHSFFILKYGKNKYRKIVVPVAPYKLFNFDWIELSIPIIGTVYLFIVIDCYTRIILGYKLALTKTKEKAIATINLALEKASTDELYNPEYLVIHHDQGSAFTSKEYAERIKTEKANLSYSDPGKPTQNPYIESFNRTIQKFWINNFEYVSFKELQESIEEFITRYNSKWKHGEAGFIEPNQILLNYKLTLSQKTKKVSKD